MCHSNEIKGNFKVTIFQIETAKTSVTTRHAEFFAVMLVGDPSCCTFQHVFRKEKRDFLSFIKMKSLFAIFLVTLLLDAVSC